MPIIIDPATGGTIANYSGMQAAILSWLHRTGDTAFALIVPDFISLAEARIYRELRIRQMETALSSAISAGVIAVPPGFLELKNAYVNGSPTRNLEKKDAEWIYAHYPTRSAEGTPIYIAREASNFIFGPYPDSAYTIKGVYYKKLTALSNSNTTNWLTTDCPDLLLFASLCEAIPWVQDDPRVSLWETKYQQIKARVQAQDVDEEFSGSPLVASVR